MLVVGRKIRGLLVVQVVAEVVLLMVAEVLKLVEQEHRAKEMLVDMVHIMQLEIIFISMAVGGGGAGAVGGDASYLSGWCWR